MSAVSTLTDFEASVSFELAATGRAIVRIAWPAARTRSQHEERAGVQAAHDV